MTRHYATVCRRGQLEVLLGSMLRHCGNFELHVLAWDWDEPRRWEQLEGEQTLATVRYTRGDAFLGRHPEYAPDRLPGPPRRPIDVVATARWRFFLDVMLDARSPVTTLDGDLWFWSSPEPMFREIGDAPVAAAPHRIPRRARALPGVCFETHRRYGLYNAGLTHWSDGIPLAAMARQTYLWSRTEVRAHPVDGEDDFGDQGALERVMSQTRGAHVIRHPGVNVAPWNVHRYGIMKAGGKVHVVDRDTKPDDCWPLVAYHYSSLRLGPTTSDGKVLVEQLADPPYELSAMQRDVLYRPYLAALRAAHNSGR